MIPSIVIRRVSVRHGARWVVDAARLFVQQAMAWLLVHLALILIGFGCVALKTIGVLLFTLLLPVFLGGLMHACREQASGQVVEIGQIFLGVRHKASALVTIGGIQLVGQIVITALTGWLGGEALQEVLGAAQQGPGAIIDPAVASQASVAALVGLALATPLALAVWFAPALVVLEDISAWRALVLSLRACVHNLLPFLLYSVVMTALLMLALIPFLLGVALWLPLMTLTIYTAYRDIFSRGPTADASAAS